MAGKLEVIVGVVDKASNGVGQVYAGTSLVDQFNTDKTGFSLVSQSTQTGVAVTAAVTSVVELTKGMVPFLSIPTNTLAGTVAFLKISADYQQDGSFQIGDVISLVGNVVGIAAGFTLLAVGTGAASTLLLGAGAVLSVASILSSDAVKNLYTSLVSPVIERYFNNTPEATYPDYWLAPDLQLVPFQMITGVYSGNVAAVHWNPDNNSVTASRVQIVDDPGSGGGLGGAVYYGGGGTIPAIVQLPEGPIGRVDIGPLEFPGANQDSYGCCSGSQDGYF
ncbi:hypothetical protein HU720_11950 [Pseudomonas sp. SWRI51]|uniref:hypothetical protein n=1 Tax=Pseudomonas sp. SWRI51 TaxID=2745491 RepID=UPI001645C497|nr:hypothetical protein [Pseudomonas sp. SWRI51]MBC3412016.1 hypothetical protein [Pseudomonas sp. SWRI51]